MEKDRLALAGPADIGLHVLNTLLKQKLSFTGIEKYTWHQRVPVVIGMQM